MKKQFFVVLGFFLSSTNSSFSQSLSVNTDGSTANASAMLDVKSTVKGMLIPRMSRTERNAITSPVTGLLIFQNAPDSIGFYYYNGTAWTWIFSNSNSDTLAWRTGGNTGTTDASHFIGTKDNIPFSIKVNNQKAGRIDHILGNSFYGYQAANVNSTGAGNSAMGYQSLLANQSGNNNTAIGYLAGRDNVAGGQNTSTGYASMILNTGSNNTAYGFYSMYNNVAGSNATAIGYQSMLYANNTTTPYTNTNVAVGYESMKGNAPASGNTGLDNTALGYQALLNNNTGNSNTATGKTSLYSNTAGSHNTATGYVALYSNTTGNSNTANGSNALYSNISGTQNTATGFNALGTNNGSFNTASGAYSLTSNTTGVSNTGMGNFALNHNTFGDYNSALGDQALNFNSTGSNNIAIGANALRNNVSGSGNTVVGHQAGLGTTGNSFSNNTMVGYQSGYGLTTGSNNVFLGYQAGFSETTVSNKLYIANSSSNPPLIYGDFSAATVGLGTITPGDKLEVNGNIRLTGTRTILASPSTTGSANSITLRAGDPYVPVGGAGGSVNITATNNMPSGGSGYGNLGLSGDVNISSGSGYNSAGGNINITAGQTSCWALTSNSHSDVNIQGGANLVAADAASINLQGGGTVGIGCPTANANGGNLILKSGIGTGTGTQGTIQLLNGNVGIGTSAPSSKLEVCGNTRIVGTLNVSSTVTSSSGITCPSDLRYKKNITALTNSTRKLMQLNAVQYNWRSEEFPNMNFNDKLQTGFIAQDLEKIFPEMVFTDDAGYKSVDYSRLTPLLVETVKEQQKEIKEISARLVEVEKLLKKH